MLQYRLRHFQTPEKPQTADLINVINQLMYLCLKNTGNFL